jgi:4-hydroxybenzoate polyprenyltransferase
MNAVEAVRTSNRSTESTNPLVVDLDGSLVKTDLLVESVVALFKQKPWYLLLLPLWLLRGKAKFKREVARRVELGVETLPYREEVLTYLKLQHDQGRTLVLATAADQRLARKVADYLGIFDRVLASDGEVNLSGAAKRDRLSREFGVKQFDYAGNSRHDLAVWSAAGSAILVHPTRLLRSAAAKRARVSCIFDGRRNKLADYFKPLRLHHWLKNVLLFVPLLAAHRFDEIGLDGKLVAAFLSFGLLASAGYVINDLLDLAADRHHPTKGHRPFASGDLPLTYALVLIPALVMAGLGIGARISQPFLDVVASYFALSLAYSLRFKWVALLDVILLAGLYSMRILAGAAAVAIWPSHWLLAFSTFFFFSLALVKRYGELVIMRRVDGDHAKARAYELDDSELIAAMGVASGFLSVLVLALYINSDKAQMLYGRYQLIWFLCPVLLYWIGRVWLIAHRGKMPDDPLVFALQDRTNRILILVMFLLVVLAL